MAESLDLKIRVTGNEQLDALIKKLNEGTGTLNDLTQAKKLLNKEFKETELGTEKYDQLARSLAVINDKQKPDMRLISRRDLNLDNSCLQRVGHREHWDNSILLLVHRS